MVSAFLGFCNVEWFLFCMPELKIISLIFITKYK